MNDVAPRKLSVCGSFGFGNAGDEAIPLAIADMARHLGRVVDVHAVTRFNNPAMPEIVGLGPRDAKRLEALRGMPLLMSGGGIIEDRHNSTFFQCEHLLKKSFTPNACLLGVSVEPGVTYGWRSKARLWWRLRQFETVYPRDELSEATLNGLLPSIKTEMVGDLVLWLRADAQELPPGLVLPEKFVAVVLAPRWIDDQRWRAWISSELRALCKKMDAALVFVPMTAAYDDDRAQHRVVIEEMKKAGSDVEIVAIGPVLSPRAIAHVLGMAELVVSMRLHGCVMAYAQQTACVGLVYHPKIMGFFSTVGLQHAVLPRAVNKMQDDPVYGYSFFDLDLKAGDLVDTAFDSLARAEYGRLTELKNRSAAALMNFMQQCESIS